MVNIHPTALISKNVKLDKDVYIGPYCNLDGDIKIGCGTKIYSHVCIVGNTNIGNNNTIYPFTAIGFEPQDKKYNNEKTYVEIGDNNIIRENVTINRGTIYENSTTKIGNNNLLMSMTHVAHDCKLGDNIVLASGSMLAGHCLIDDFVIIGGMSGIHQFCKIGKYSMIGGGSIIRGHVLPFSLTKNNAVVGINIIGLKRKNFINSDIKIILNSFKIVANKDSIFIKSFEELKKDINNKNIKIIVDFMENLLNTNIGLCPFDL